MPMTIKKRGDGKDGKLGHGNNTTFLRPK